MSPSNPRPQPPIDYANPRHLPANKFKSWLYLGILLVIVILLCIYMTSTDYVSPRVVAVADRIKSAANLRQVGVEIGAYAKNHNGDYPDSLQTLLLDGDVPNAAILVSPSGTDTPPTVPTTRAIADQLIAGGHLSYVYLGRGLTTNSVTPNTIIAYELIQNPGDTGNILFGDGHTADADATHTAKIIARAASGQFPVTMPSP